MMKTKNILRTFLVSAFVLGTLAVNAQDKVYVHKTDKSAVEFTISDVDSISFTAPAPAPVDYTKLKLNEVSGVGNDCEKFYELINLGNVDIPLLGCKIYYNANGVTGGTLPTGKGQLTWTGVGTQVASAGQLFSLIGRNGGNCSNPPTENSFTTGLTAARILIITLEDPNGNIIDQCIRASDTGLFEIDNRSFARIPDGTGPFFFSIPSPGLLNRGILEVPTEPIPVADYSQLVINEVDGNGKFVEIYNKGTKPVSLIGVTLVKNGKEAWWTGSKADAIIAAGGFYTISQSGQSTGCASESTGASGISPKQNVKFELKEPDGTLIDFFVRTNGGDWGTGVTPDFGPGVGFSFSRCPDGTGTFQLADPSCNAPNNPCVGEIITDPLPEPEIDYTQLVINEVDGNGKFVEIYNKGTNAISLTGVTLIKNEDTKMWWTGGASAIIAAGGFYSISTAGDKAADPAATENTGASGISPKQNLKFEMKNPKGELIDEFVRTNGGAWGLAVTPDYATGPYSFSRCPNGTGTFQLATPSCNVTNNPSQGPIVTNP